MKRWYRHYAAGKRFVYLDESGFEPETTRTHGWARRGEAVHGFRSGNRRPRTSLIAARTTQGLEAPMLFCGTCNTAIFNQWLEEMLCPLLTENDVVVMDNAAFHKSEETKRLIEKTGATLLYLPPYSPELNPIEKDFANLKRNRKYAENKSIDAIINAYNYLVK